ncbi:carbohydrate ABC transporter permease [Microbacterium sp. NPDC019599]|uniref:carbohydrate ABC transporter permease n=1 Tax=Microbacterium sp. NPDC019599 TaxID=3154690 RepID=UPI003406B8F4
MSATTQLRAVTGGRTPRRARAGVRRPNVLGALGGYAWLLLIVIPVYYIVITSLRRQEGFFSENQLLPPANPTLDAYALVLQGDFALYLINSVIVTVVTVGVTVAASLMAAFVIVRSTHWTARASFALLLMGLAIPLQATIVPLFFMLSQVGLYDSLAAVILPSIGFAVPITVLILVNFIRDIPAELFDSMKVDGAGQWRILWSLVAPLARPAITTVAIYDALTVWNAFLFPLVLTQSPENRVLPLALWTFQGEFNVNVPGIMAAVVLSTLPILVLYIFGRRHIVSGMTAGFGK